ncbi:hypothetical protein [Bradyrhizobium sp. USDA 3458]|uniref:hypothetical protein n=1 Tax=Bradyrhizobium sp. USDA 3458 TaxID=2591461 RepID=UPI001142863F|nr:hypothetical protein [Bradyrhizobium sp. USDA 3458]
MTEIELNRLDVDVEIEKIEVDHEFEADKEAPHRTLFDFRLCYGNDGWQTFHVTMTEPYSDMADLEKKAWREAYALLCNFAEVIKRKHNLPDIKFKD